MPPSAVYLRQPPHLSSEPKPPAVSSVSLSCTITRLGIRTRATGRSGHMASLRLRAPQSLVQNNCPRGRPRAPQSSGSHGLVHREEPQGLGFRSEELSPGQPPPSPDCSPPRSSHTFIPPFNACSRPMLMGQPPSGLLPPPRPSCCPAVHAPTCCFPTGPPSNVTQPLGVSPETSLPPASQPVHQLHSDEDGISYP